LKERFFLFLWKETNLFNTEKTSHMYIIISHIKFGKVKKVANSKLIARSENLLKLD